MRASTSASQASGSMSLSLAVMINVVTAAARSAPRSEPANNHDFLPRAKPRSARSAALLKACCLRHPLSCTPSNQGISLGCRDRGVGSTQRRQADLTMSCELELLLGRPYDLPGCAASADP
jgi:hypothetical protein